MAEKIHSKKIVVVTGASAGLGRAIVREFAKRGDDVALIARGVEGLEGAKKGSGVLRRPCIGSSFGRC